MTDLEALKKDFADLDWTAAKAENARLRERERALIDELAEARRERDDYKADADKEWAECIRASALEEAARKVESTVLVWNGYEWGYSRADAAESIRALAKSPPSGRFVANEVTERVEKALEASAEVIVNAATLHRPGDREVADECESALAALNAEKQR